MRSTEVEVQARGATLAGTRLDPPQPRGAILLVNGSGPLDRDSNMDGQELEIASTLAAALGQAGWTSFRYDKRGVGASTGSALTSGFEDETDDAEAALQYLRTDGFERVVVIGHSVGGAVATRLAVRHQRVSPATGGVVGVVLLATPAQPLAAVARWQTDRIAATLPGPSWLAPPLFRVAQRRGWDKIEGSTGDTIRGLFRRHPARWYREALAYDPAADLAAVTCPVLAITGRKDLQVDAADVATIGRLVGGPFEGETPSGLTHLLRTEAGMGGILGYRKQMSRPVDPALVERVVTWVGER